MMDFISDIAVLAALSVVTFPSSVYIEIVGKEYKLYIYILKSFSVLKKFSAPMEVSGN